jgi:hypothetical protein
MDAIIYQNDSDYGKVEWLVLDYLIDTDGDVMGRGSMSLNIDKYEFFTSGEVRHLIVTNHDDNFEIKEINERD